MKKYIIPTTKVFNLTSESLIAASDPIINNELGGDGQDTRRQQESPIWDTWSN